MSCIRPTAPHFSSSSPSRRAKCRITPSTARPWVMRAGESLYLHNSWYASSLVGFRFHYTLSRFICISSNHTRWVPENQPERRNRLLHDWCRQLCKRCLHKSPDIEMRVCEERKAHPFPESLAIYLQRIIVSYCSRVGMRTVAEGAAYGADENNQRQHDGGESGIRGQAVGNGRRAARQHGFRRIQTRRPGSHLPQVHLRPV